MRLLLLIFFLQSGWVFAQTFTNPLLPDGADPWVLSHDGWIYYTNTTGRNLTLWRTRSLAELSKAEAKVVWSPPETGPNSRDIWAPELHRLDDKWYFYYTATDKVRPGDNTRYVFVLENSSPDPLSGTWTDKGRVNTRYSGLDGSVFELRGKRYFVYSAYDGPQSVLCIAPLKNPWTLASEEVIIARPEHDWEKYDRREICEGPQFLRRDSRSPLCLVYSASACWDDDYCLGLLTAPPDADPLDPAVWRKTPQPVFQKSIENGVYGPGHNGFATSPDGTQHWLVYHAKSVANKACRERNPRMQPFGWKPDGTPDFGVPVKVGTPVRWPQAK